MGRAGNKGYRFDKAYCPGCKRIISISYCTDGKRVLFRRHTIKRRMLGDHGDIPDCYVRYASRSLVKTLKCIKITEDSLVRNGTEDIVQAIQHAANQAIAEKLDEEMRRI